MTAELDIGDQLGEPRQRRGEVHSGLKGEQERGAASVQCLRGVGYEARGLGFLAKDVCRDKSGRNQALKLLRNSTPSTGKLHSLLMF